VRYDDDCQVTFVGGLGYGFAAVTLVAMVAFLAVLFLAVCAPVARL
jgi:hypothetical protein